jgi:hypothetical protein
MMRFTAIVLGLLVVGVVSPAWAVSCPYMPAFLAIRQQLSSLTPAAALTALEHLSTGDENPNACESIDIARLMSEQETRLVFLVDGSTRIPPQASFRCSRLRSATIHCDGAVADDTTTLLTARISPLSRPVHFPLAIVSDTESIALLNVYRASLGDLVDGKPPIRLRRHGDEIETPSLAAGSVIIAIFRGAMPWAYRKLVWYF